ncbi:hypothetical protein [Rhodovarius sp.]|jgi:hypothetical protein|uniref:hypothetical protein n=1 Tax=Rhodovarius sp. TaxID=2972673 RepID=UPI003340B886
MSIADCHWREIEAYLTVDDRCLLPFGSPWQLDDAVLDRICQAGVAETQAALEGPWPNR